MFFTSTYDSPVGTLTLASDGDALCGLWLAGQKYHGCSIPEEVTANDKAFPFGECKTWLDHYFAGKKPSPRSLPLAPRGTRFRQLVWEALLEIPYGTTITYGSIAKQLRNSGEKAAPIAVGGAVGHNPISIIIPCHRVIGESGSLTGYAGGLDRKIFLLQHEQVPVDSYFIPSRGTAL